MFVDIFQVGRYLFAFKDPRSGDVMSGISRMDTSAGELERGTYQV